MQCTIGVQTDSYLEARTVIPIPVPIYLPTPMAMYAMVSLINSLHVLIRSTKLKNIFMN